MQWPCSGWTGTICPSLDPLTETRDLAISKQVLTNQLKEAEWKPRIKDNVLSISLILWYVCIRVRKQNLHVSISQNVLCTTPATVLLYRVQCLYTRWPQEVLTGECYNNSWEKRRELLFFNLKLHVVLKKLLIFRFSFLISSTHSTEWASFFLLRRPVHFKWKFKQKLSHFVRFPWLIRYVI